MKISFYSVTVIVLIVLTFVLRFSRYTDRWGLAYDQAHDAMIARFALSSGQIPLLGPFSSAGPFQTSGVWYWFIMVGTFFYPQAVISPWILMTISYVFLVFFSVLLGRYLVDRTFGLILGILTMVSTAQIAQSVNLTNQSPLALTSFAALTSFVLYGKTKRLRYLFFLGFFISLSASIHLQGVSLISLLFVAILLFGTSGRGLILSLVGLLIPVTPILLFDLGNEFVNTKNMLHYVFVDQYKISLEVLGRRWKTFVSVFLPFEWSHIIGGKPVIGGLLLLGSLILIPLFKRKKIILGILLSTVCMITILRYTRTPIFSSYVVFLHPFILMLSSFVVYIIYKQSKLLGLLIFVLLVYFSMQKSIEEINYGINLSDQQTTHWVGVLHNRFPDSKFSVYDYQRQTVGSSIVLSLYLDIKQKISTTDKKLAMMSYPPQTTMSADLVYFDSQRTIYDVSASDSATLEKLGWSRINPEDIYNETEFWKEKKH